jgi:hypothetical protein
MIDEVLLIGLGIVLVCIGVWYFASWIYVVIGIILVGYALLIYFLFKRIVQEPRKPEQWQ